MIPTMEARRPQQTARCIDDCADFKSVVAPQGATDLDREDVAIANIFKA